MNFRHKDCNVYIERAEGTINTTTTIIFYRHTTWPCVNNKTETTATIRKR